MILYKYAPASTLTDRSSVRNSFTFACLGGSWDGAVLILRRWELMLAFPVDWNWGCAAVYILPPWPVDKSKLCYGSCSTNQYPEVVEGFWLLDSHKIL